MIVMSMTLGQTNNSGKARILGTVLGSVLALAAWFMFAINPHFLAIFGWIVSLPCFWIILTWKQATFGRFILLTYNLSVLYAYSLAMADGDGDGDDDEGGVNPIITEIVRKLSVYSVVRGLLLKPLCSSSFCGRDRWRSLGVVHQSCDLAEKCEESAQEWVECVVVQDGTNLAAGSFDEPYRVSWVPRREGRYWADFQRQGREREKVHEHL
jgi:hypothetical protein